MNWSISSSKKYEKISFQPSSALRTSAPMFCTDGLSFDRFTVRIGGDESVDLAESERKSSQCTCLSPVWWTEVSPHRKITKRFRINHRLRYVHVRRFSARTEFRPIHCLNREWRRRWSCGIRAKKFAAYLFVSCVMNWSISSSKKYEKISYPPSSPRRASAPIHCTDGLSFDRFTVWFRVRIGQIMERSESIQFSIFVGVWHKFFVRIFTK